MRARQSFARRSVGALATSVLVLSLAACGDDEDAAPAATTAAPAAATAATTAAAAAAPTTMAAPAEGGITVMEAWSRMPAAGQATSAVYATVMNATEADVTIVGVTTSVGDRAELHEMLMGDDGTMTMQEKEGGFVVPAGGEFLFESGGPHIMVFDVSAADYPDTVDVTLTLDNGETVDFTAEVRAVDATDETSGMDMSGDSDHASGEDHASGDDDHSGPAESLHDVDEQLAEGMLDPSQLVVVQSAIDELGEPAAGTPEAEYLAVLEELMTALEAGDAAAAAPLATQAHDMGHELEEHNG